MERRRLEALVAKKGADAKRGTLDIDIEEDLALECRYVDFLVASACTNGKCSKLLRNMMAAYQAGLPQRTDGRDHLFDPEAVCETIRVLEGLSKDDLTKGPFRYEKGPLTGLYKKHFFQPSFLVNNILLELERDGVGLIYRKLSEFYGKGKYLDRPLNEIDAQLIAEALSADSIERRALRRRTSADGGLTGEHLIYAKSQSGNLYLYASFHGENLKRIVECVSCCSEDFPELLDAAPLLAEQTVSL